jgi:hypothetical protein
MDLFHFYPKQFVGVLERRAVDDLVDRYGFGDRFKIQPNLLLTIDGFRIDCAERTGIGGTGDRLDDFAFDYTSNEAAYTKKTSSLPK